MVGEPGLRVLCFDHKQWSPPHRPYPLIHPPPPNHPPEIVHDVAVEAHRRARTGAPGPPPTANDEAPPPAAHGAHARAPPAASRASHAAMDAFGAPLRATGGGGGGGGGGDVECTQCGRRVAASRFAPHLEKCLGGGRAAGRAASRRQYAE